MTYDEIKKMFFKYDCSLFAIAREQKEVYENYKKLNISKATLEEWKQELFLALWKQLKQNGSSDLFNRMCGLSENRHNRENLLILKEALNDVNYKSPKINTSISETVLGRKELPERSGLIFWAYDLGEKKIADELLKFVIDLLKVQTSDKKIKERLERAIKKCYLIKAILNSSL